MKRARMLLCAAGLACSWPAAAQTWSDLDCARSAIKAPAGFKCRATAPVTNANDGRGIRSYAAWGTLDGRDVVVRLVDGIGADSWLNPLASWELKTRLERIKPLDTSSDWSRASGIGEISYRTFSMPGGRHCAAMTRNGPPVPQRRGWDAGYAWVMYGAVCNAPGQPIDLAAIESFAPFLQRK